MHEDYPRPQLAHIRTGVAEVWRTLYAHRLLNAAAHRVLATGEVVQLFNFSRQAGSLWAQVDTLSFANNQRLYQKGFLRLPPTDPNSILAFIPDYRYFTNFCPGGLPSHLAVGDTIVLVEAYPPTGAPTYTAIPDNENAPATAGIFEKRDVARVVEGPFRTESNLLYWKIDNLNGTEDGIIQEYTRLGHRYRFFLRPHILANP
jgi:hypothetical protein